MNEYLLRIAAIAALFFCAYYFVYENRKRKEWTAAELDMLAFFVYAGVMVLDVETGTRCFLAVLGTSMMIVSTSVSRRATKENGRPFDEGEKYLLDLLFESLKPKEPVLIPQNEDEFRKVLIDILNETKNFIENKQGYKLFWNDDKTPKKESKIHIYFDNIMEVLCCQQNIDISSEPFMGRGPVDFKFSATDRFRACLELKLSSNKKLNHGLAKQLPAYMSPKKIRIGFFVVVILKEEDRKKIDKLLEEETALEKQRNISIDIITMDATLEKPSASRI